MPTETGRRCRLLLAIPELDRGGPDRVFFELARSLDRDRFDIHLVVVGADGYYLGELPTDVEVHHLGTTKVRTFDRYPGVRLARLTRRLQPDVVMTTLRMIVAAELTEVLPRKHALVARAANHLTSGRTDESVTTSTRARVFHDLMVRGVRHADLAVAQSTSMAADLAASGVDPSHIRTIANPIDGGWVDARTAEGPPTPLPGSPRLLGVGRLEQQKGFDLLIRALPAVRAVHPDAQVTILGEGGQRPEIEALARELGVRDAVSLPGNDPNPFRSYASADLLVAPSRWEGLSNTMLEALAAGLPVVGADGAAAGQDLITSPELGRLVHPEDVDGLVGAILDALATDFDRAHVAATTRSRFETATIVDAYADLLLEAAALGARWRSAP